MLLLQMALLVVGISLLVLASVEATLTGDNVDFLGVGKYVILLKFR